MLVNSCRSMTAVSEKGIDSKRTSGSKNPFRVMSFLISRPPGFSPSRMISRSRLVPVHKVVDRVPGKASIHSFETCSSRCGANVFFDSTVLKKLSCHRVAEEKGVLVRSISTQSSSSRNTLNTARNGSSSICPNTWALLRRVPMLITVFFFQRVLAMANLLRVPHGPICTCR